MSSLSSPTKMIELVAGAVLETALTELLKLVLYVMRKASSFRTILTRLESTLRKIKPHFDEINRLNNQLDPPQPVMKELGVIIRDGKALVLKCSKISIFNLVKRLKYSKKLSDLDNSLLRYCNTILPLENMKETKKTHVMLYELEKKLVVFGNAGVQKAKKLKKKFLGDEDELKKKLMGDEDGGVYGSGVQKAKKLFTHSIREDHVGIIDEEVCNRTETQKLKGTIKNMEEKVGNWYQDASKLNPKYEQIIPSGKKLSLLKGCLHHNFNLDDLVWSEAAVLGKGIFGTTYMYNSNVGEYRIKRLTEVNVGESKFRQRIKDLGKVGQHPNIMPPIGYHFSEYEKLLIYGYSSVGSLYALLHEYKGSGRTPLDWNSRLKISLGTAMGIAHVHSKGGDVGRLGSIKSSNVLLTSAFDGCISDYGLTPLMNDFATSSQDSGYHAPEISLIGKLRVTRKSDVYSFGVLLLEILTGKNPALVDLPRWVHSKMWEERLVNYCDKELLRFRHFEAEMQQMLKIAMLCVEKNPDKRPKMDSVAKMVKNIRSSH